MLRGMVPDALLPRAMANNSARDSAVHLASGSLGGALMALGRAYPLLAGAVLCLLGAAACSPIRRYWKLQREKGGDAQAPPGLRDAFGGLRWLLGYPFQRRFTLIGAFAAGAGSCFLFVTVLEISAAASETVSAGMVNAAAAAGMLVGALTASKVIVRLPSGVLVAVMFGTMAVGFSVAALVPGLPVKAVCVAFALVALPAGSAVLTSFFNLLVGKDKLGRVGAGQKLVQFGVLSLLTVCAGWVMEQWGYRAVCFGLVALIVLCALSALTMKALVTIPTPDRWGEHIQRWKLAGF